MTATPRSPTNVGTQPTKTHRLKASDIRHVNSESLTTQSTTINHQRHLPFAIASTELIRFVVFVPTNSSTTCRHILYCAAMHSTTTASNVPTHYAHWHSAHFDSFHVRRRRLRLAAEAQLLGCARMPCEVMHKRVKSKLFCPLPN